MYLVGPRLSTSPRKSLSAETTINTQQTSEQTASTRTSAAVCSRATEAHEQRNDLTNAVARGQVNLAVANGEQAGPLVHLAEDKRALPRPIPRNSVTSAVLRINHRSEGQGVGIQFF